MARSGAAEWIAETAFAPWVHDPWVFLAGVVVLTLVLTEAISNTAVVAVLMPLALPLGQAMGISGYAVALAVAVPAGLTFMLPMGTPATALAIGTGRVGVWDTVRIGIFLMASAWAAFMLTARYVWPLLGIEFDTPG